MSYANLILYNAIIPSLKTGNDKTQEERINASDPKNKKLVHKIMFGD